MTLLNRRREVERGSGMQSRELAPRRCNLFLVVYGFTRTQTTSPVSNDAAMQFGHVSQAFKASGVYGVSAFNYSFSELITRATECFNERYVAGDKRRN